MILTLHVSMSLSPSLHQNSGQSCWLTPVEVGTFILIQWHKDIMPTHLIGQLFSDRNDLISHLSRPAAVGCWLAPLPFLGVESPCQGSACTSGGGGRRVPSERPLKLLRLQHRLPISIARPTAQLNLSMNFLCCYLVLRRSGLKV